jgi:hypothetical protein
MDVREAINTTQQPDRLRKFSKRLFVWAVGSIVLLVAFLWILSVRTAWVSFQSDLTTYHGATIGMTKIDAQYALDTPQTVQGPEMQAEDGWKTSTPLRVNPAEENRAIPDGYDPIPTGKSAMDYDSWHFWNERGSFDVDFNAKSHRLESIACYSDKPTACDPLFGIGLGTREDEILDRLGKPDKQEISGGDMIKWGAEQFPTQVAKTMDYNRLGLHLVLAKKTVTSISKRSPQEAGFWWWFTHGRIG